jgi:hypothetical protein
LPERIGEATAAALDRRRARNIHFVCDLPVTA